MQAQWLIFAALLMAVGGALLLLLQARNGSREQRLIEGFAEDGFHRGRSSLRSGQCRRETPGVNQHRRN